MSPKHLALVLAASLPAGCANDPQRPAPPAFPESASFSVPIAAAGPAVQLLGPWWNQVVDPTLQPTLAQALAMNPTLRRAVADVDAAQARLAQAEANRGPELTARAGAGVQKASGGDATDNRSAGLDGQLPIDANGALAHRRDAERRLLEAAVDDLAQQRSDLARDFLLAALDRAEAGQRSGLLTDQLEVTARLLELVELRFTQGLASAVDVLQQRDQLATLRQQLPVARRDRLTAGNRLRLAAHLTPEQPLPVDTERLPAIPPGPVGVAPLSLLDRRASLRAERARLAAADARFAAALADRWPTLSLSGSVFSRVASGDVSTLLAAAIDAAFTLFDGGGKQAVAAERRAQLVAAGERYLSAWMMIVIDADNLVHEEASLQERITLSQQRLETAQALLTAARRRYERGVSDYLPVLEALRGLQQQQRDHLALQADLARTRIRRHHILGQAPQEAQ